MDNKLVVITGASDGIGEAIARGLRARGASVVVVGRSPTKTRAVAESIDSDYFVADFAVLSQVETLARKLLQGYPRIDALINNAGGIFGERELTVDGHEKTMQVNHLAHFKLTNMLLPTLIASNATVINTSSVAAKLFSDLKIDDLEMAQRHNSRLAYGNAKLENILFTTELQRRFGPEGIATAAFHPGNVSTNFAHDSDSILRFVYTKPLRRLFGLISPEQGADTAIWLATTTPGKDWQPGGYYYKRVLSKSHQNADDVSLAAALWEQSEAMIA